MWGRHLSVLATHLADIMPRDGLQVKLNAWESLALKASANKRKFFVRDIKSRVSNKDTPELHTPADMKFEYYKEEILQRLKQCRHLQYVDEGNGSYFKAVDPKKSASDANVAKAPPAVRINVAKASSSASPRPLSSSTTIAYVNQPSYRELVQRTQITIPEESTDTSIAVSPLSSAELPAKLLEDPHLPVKVKRSSLACEANYSSFEESALLGSLRSASKQVYLNTHEPFTMVAVGLQGSGKSHTLSCILESCLLPMPGVIRLKQSMTSLVLHYDQNPSSICEATGLIESPFTIDGCTPHVGREQLLVLVSPSYYQQRKDFYGDYCIVKPLLLRWSTMTANHIKSIMRIEEDGNQLYVAGLLDLLRRYQRENLVPEYEEFVSEVKGACNLSAQTGPLEQRLRLLSSIIAESEENRGHEGTDLLEACKPGMLVVADLTDPLLSSTEVNGIFQILVEQFRAAPGAGGSKLLVVDEAHKYMSGKSSDGLSEAIVNVSRLMRHDGIRLVVSTQSPLVLAPELLELSTVAVLHHFHSPDWFHYLKGKLPLVKADWDRILELDIGSALVYASRHQIEHSEDDESVSFLIRMRKKITSDRGRSKTNRAHEVNI